MTLKKFRRSAGQSLVETALVLPVILLLLLGIVEFGRVFSAYLVITNASREGARCAAVNRTDTNVVDVVRGSLISLNLSSSTIRIQPEGSLRESGKQVSVEVDYTMNFITPLMSGIVRGPVTLKSVTVMRVE